MNRQQIRWLLLLVSFIILPVTLFYISPIILLMGLSSGIATGSLILFIITFLLSLFLGRFWCGWFCPMGGLQEMCTHLQDQPVSGGARNLIKYGVWALWFLVVLLTLLTARGIHTVDVFFGTNSGISLTDPSSFVVFYVILGMILLFAIIAGKRGFCHYICPVCIHFIIGRKIRNLFRWPALQVTGDVSRCTGCGKCSKACPMGLDVKNMVQENRMEDPECILCASCADSCPQHAITYGLHK